METDDFDQQMVCVKDPFHWLKHTTQTNFYYPSLTLSLSLSHFVTAKFCILTASKKQAISGGVSFIKKDR